MVLYPYMARELQPERRAALTPGTVAGVFLLGFASFAAGKDTPEKVSPRISDSKELSVEMAKALVAGNRERFTALAATREEMVRMLETALHPAEPGRTPGAEGQGRGDSCRAQRGFR